MKTVSCHFHFPAVSGGEEQTRIVAPDDREMLNAADVRGDLFHAAWSKNAFIAETLVRLYPDPALLCDADVSLTP